MPSSQKKLEELTKPFFAIFLVMSCGLCLAQQHGNSSENSTAYENHNQIDYRPLKVRLVEGASIIQIGTEKQSGVPGAFLVLFTEKSHKLIAKVKADASGHFEMTGIAPGRYRLIARAAGLCTANIPLRVLHPADHQETEILVHFRPAGIDTCSYGELERVPAKPTLTTH